MNRPWRRTALALLLGLTTASHALADSTVRRGGTGGGEPEKEKPSVGGEAEAYGQTPAQLVPYGRSRAPYRRLYLDPPLFRGPGREKPEPGPDAIRIGLIAPLKGTSDAWAGQNLERGVVLALEEANASGGHRGLPFEHIARNDVALWGSSANTLVDLAYGDGVWAVIGSIDSNSTHVALRVALRAEIMMVNVGSTDPTITETAIPWIIRCTPDDRQTGYRLARLIFEERDLSRVAVLRSSDRYGRFGVREFRDAARRLARPLPMEIQFRPDREDFAAQLEQLAASAVDGVVIWTKAEQAASLVRQMRERDLDLPIFGTDRMVSRAFLDGAGPAAEGVVATAWMSPTREDESWRRFRERYDARFGNDPDAFSAYGYDAARLVVEAVRHAGLNRARIRDALMDVREYDGVAGTMLFDATSNNVAPPVLVRVEGGRFVRR